MMSHRYPDCKIARFVRNIPKDKPEHISDMQYAYFWANDLLFHKLTQECWFNNFLVRPILDLLIDYMPAARKDTLGNAFRKINSLYPRMVNADHSEEQARENYIRLRAALSFADVSAEALTVSRLHMQSGLRDRNVPLQTELQDLSLVPNWATAIAPFIAAEGEKR